jgi:hypothetical protein
MRKPFYVNDQDKGGLCERRELGVGPEEISRPETIIHAAPPIDKKKIGTDLGLRQGLKNPIRIQ